MKFSRRTARNTFYDHKRNEKMFEEVRVEPVDEKLRRYKSYWLAHVTRMNNNRILKIMLNYRPNERRRFGRTLTRLLDKAATGLSRLDS
jgi:hypothetical protein